MRRNILPLVLGCALSVAAVAPAAASNHQDQRAIQTALVGVIVQAAVRDVNVAILNDSLNNLLQNADIDINVLNNSLNRVLQNVDVNVSEITVVGDDLVLQVAVLGGNWSVTDITPTP